MAYQVLPHVSILAHQLRYLLLEAVVFLHQQLVHRRQFSVHTLKSSRFLPLLLSTPKFVSQTFISPSPTINVHSNIESFMTQKDPIFLKTYSNTFSHSHSKSKPPILSILNNNQNPIKQIITYLRFWNQTLICLASMFERIGHSRISCCRRRELGFGHSAYTLSSASTCSAVYRTYFPASRCLLMLPLLSSRWRCATIAIFPKLEESPKVVSWIKFAALYKILWSRERSFRQ